MNFCFQKKLYLIEWIQIEKIIIRIHNLYFFTFIIVIYHCNVTYTPFKLYLYNVVSSTQYEQFLRFIARKCLFLFINYKELTYLRYFFCCIFFVKEWRVSFYFNNNNKYAIFLWTLFSIDVMHCHLNQVRNVYHVFYMEIYILWK